MNIDFFLLEEAEHNPGTFPHRSFVDLLVKERELFKLMDSGADQERPSLPRGSGVSLLQLVSEDEQMKALFTGSKTFIFGHISHTTGSETLCFSHPLRTPFHCTLILGQVLIIKSVP